MALWTKVKRWIFLQICTSTLWKGRQTVTINERSFSLQVWSKKVTILTLLPTSQYTSLTLLHNHIKHLWFTHNNILWKYFIWWIRKPYKNKSPDIPTPQKNKRVQAHVCEDWHITLIQLGLSLPVFIMIYQYNDTIQCYHLTVTSGWCKPPDIELCNLDKHKGALLNQYTFKLCLESSNVSL